MWDSVDEKPAWKFWDDVEETKDSKHGRKAGIQITSRAAAASCCEFNWSDLDDIIGKRRTQLKTVTIEKLARNRAVSRLKSAVATMNCAATLPTLADCIDTEMQKVQARAGEATEAEDDIMDDESGSDISLSEESDSDSEESEADYDQGQESLTTVGSRYQDKDDQISP